MSWNAKFEANGAVTLVSRGQKQVCGNFRNLTIVKIYLCRAPDQKFGAQTPTNYTYPVRYNQNL